MGMKKYVFDFPKHGQHVPTKFYLAADVEAWLEENEKILSLERKVSDALLKECENLERANKRLIEQLKGKT
jgi:hypothetical protein